MDGFGLLIFGGFIVFFLILLALGKWYPGSGAEQLDWKPTRSLETEVELELDDIDQMLEAQNERRRARGQSERTEDDVRAEVAAEEREMKARAERYKQGGEPADF